MPSSLPTAHHLLPFIALWPLFGVMVTYATRGKTTGVISLLVVGVNLLAVSCLTLAYLSGPLTVTHNVGGWAPPLGIRLMVDGFSLLMLWIAAITTFGSVLYSMAYFREHNPLYWPLVLSALAGFNALVISGDLFTIYIAIEMLTFAAVGLAGWGGHNTSRRAALRYLFTSALGSMCYVLGVSLLYLEYELLDVAILLHKIHPSPLTWAACSAISLGLMIKAALFPFHFWLPATHASAVSPVSALLSGMIVKAPIYVLVRLWTGLALFTDFQIWLTLFAVLGAGAVLWAGYQAVVATRIKHLIAYSTVAQIGYVFLALSLITDKHDALPLSALYFFLLSHALAKAALFLAAGTIVKAAGRDDLKGLTGAATHLPLALGAIALAGVSLIGLPPSGGFIGKWMLLANIIDKGLWWMVAVIFMGTLAAAAYVYRMISLAFDRSGEQFKKAHWKPVPMALQMVPMSLALLAIAIGFFAPPLSDFFLRS
ncbi:MAG: proton-conducting transporter membrane subunit [Ketobacteraceae bacterium]|nr:proton-conducting transporter membrane subunit [Ketobacteraceae bacterium]